jgi:hypothetical protein
MNPYISPTRLLLTPAAFSVPRATVFLTLVDLRLAMVLDGATERILESNCLVISFVEGEEGEDVSCADRDTKKVGSRVGDRRGSDRGSASVIVDSPACAKAC